MLVQKLFELVEDVVIGFGFMMMSLGLYKPKVTLIAGSGINNRCRR